MFNEDSNYLENGTYSNYLGEVIASSITEKLVHTLHFKAFLLTQELLITFVENVKVIQLFLSFVRKKLG